MKLNPHRILIILHGSIGDVTRALPIANLIRRAFPKAFIAWSVEPAAHPLVERHCAVDEVLLFDRKRWWSSLGPFLWKIRSGSFDLVLDLQRHLKSGLISFWSGAPYRLGFHRYDSKEFNWLFNNYYIPPVGNGISKLNHYLKFAEYLDIEAWPVEWGLRLSTDEETAVEELLKSVQKPFAAFFVGSRWESKQWFPAQSAASASAIQKRFGLGIVLLGGKKDRRFAEELTSAAGSEMTNLVGETSLRQAVGILGRACVAVGPDTGLMHISAAVGTPVVSLWGPTSPIRTGPYGFENLIIQGKAACAPCYLKRCPIGRICMQSIDIEDVTAMVSRVLSQNGLKVVGHGDSI